MGIYRISRNIEASIIDYLKSEFITDWGSNKVEKTFTRIYDIELPSICIRVGNTNHNWAEIGERSTIRESQVLIDIFANSDGQRLDIKDWLINKVKNGFVYYDYIINDGIVQTKTSNGRIRVINIEDTPINFDTDKNELDVHDRFRHLITLTISLGRIET